MSGSFQRFLAGAAGVCVLLLMAGCGGGGSSAAPGTAAPVTPTAPVVPTVTAASTVPAAATALISQVLTTGGAGAWGAAVDVRPVGTAGEATVMAVDAGGRIVLGAKSSADKPELSADSTALLLARLMLGVPAAGQTVDQANADLRNAAAFGNLVTAVQNALNAGTTPSVAPAVLSALTTVVQQGADAMTARLQAAQPGKQAQLVSSPSVTTPAPYVVFSGLGQLGSVYVAEATKARAEGVDVVNAMPIQWSVRSTTPDGGTLISKGSTHSDGHLSLKPATAFAAMADVLGLQTGNKLADGLVKIGPTIVASNGGRNFNLTIEQTAESRSANVYSMVASVLLTTLGGTSTMSEECASAIAAVVIQPDDMGAIVGSPDLTTLFAYLRTSAKAQILKALTGSDPAISSKCSADLKASVAAGTFTKLLALFNPVVELVVVAMDANRYETLMGKVYFTFKYWPEGAKKTVGVCQTAAPGGTYVLTNCTARLSFDPPTLLLAAGAVFQPALKAFDTQGAETGLPAALQFSASGDGFSLEPNTGQISALAVGNGLLTVTDPSAGVSGTSTVAVRSAVLSPASVVVPVGTAFKMSLVDAQGSGQLVNHQGSGTTWRSTAPAFFDLVASSGAEYPSVASVMPLRPGTGQLEVVNPADPTRSMRANVTVQGNVALHIDASPSPAPVGGLVSLSVYATEANGSPLAAQPLGKVTLRDATNRVLCTLTLPTTPMPVACNTSFSGLPRTELVQAAYETDGVYLSASTAGSLSLVLQSAPVTVTASASPNPAVIDASVALSATVSASGGLPTPTGSVDFVDQQGTRLCTALLDAVGNAVCNGHFAGSARTEVVRAQYSGSNQYGTGSGTLSVTLTTAPRLTPSLSLSTSVANPRYDSPVTFVVYVGPRGGAYPVPGGRVKLMDGQGLLLCTMDLQTSGDWATGTCQVPFSGAPRTLPVQAYYEGDARWNAVLSSALNVTLASSVPTVTVQTLLRTDANWANPTFFGDNVWYDMVFRITCEGGPCASDVGLRMTSMIREAYPIAAPLPVSYVALPTSTGDASMGSFALFNGDSTPSYTVTFRVESANDVNRFAPSGDYAVINQGNKHSQAHYDAGYLELVVGGQPIRRYDFSASGPRLVFYACAALSAEVCVQAP